MKKPNILEEISITTCARVLKYQDQWFWRIEVNIRDFHHASSRDEESELFAIDTDCWNDMISKYGKVSQELLMKLGAK